MMKRKTSISVFICTLVLATVAVAQDLSVVKPDTVGLSSDRLDRIVQQILENLRKGKETPLPGLGKFTHGPDGRIAFELEGGKRSD